MQAQQFVIQSQQGASRNGMSPLGPRMVIMENLSFHNTGPDQKDGDVLYGPGIEIELRPDEDPIRQMLLTIIEEDIGWLVLERLAKSFAWRVVDPKTGREWKPR